MLRGIPAHVIIRSFLISTQYLNPDTLKPWSDEAIRRDIRAIERDWQEGVDEDTKQEHRGRLVAEAREARRIAWQGPVPPVDLQGIYQGIDREARLMGLDKSSTEGSGGYQDNRVAIIIAPGAKEAGAQLLAADIIAIRDGRLAVDKPKLPLPNRQPRLRRARTNRTGPVASADKDTSVVTGTRQADRPQGP